MKNYRLFLLLIILLVIAFMADIAIGSVNLSIRDVWDTLTGGSDNLSIVKLSSITDFPKH